MSMNTYPLNEAAGLVITGPLAVLINSQTYAAAEGSDPANMTPEELIANFGDSSDAEAALRDKDVDVIFCPEFEGTASPLKAPNDTEDHDINLEDDSLVYIPCAKAPSLFSAAYASFEELAGEFRQKLEAAGFDLTDFPLEDYICKISGTYFC